MTNSNEKVQEALQAVHRHGYAAYAGDIMVAWGISQFVLRNIAGVTHLVNVQNGGVIEL